MVRVLMHGCCGAMGRVITGLAADREDLKIVAGVDRNRRSGMNETCCIQRGE